MGRETGPLPVQVRRPYLVIVTNTNMPDRGLHRIYMKKREKIDMYLDVPKQRRKFLHKMTVVSAVIAVMGSVPKSLDKKVKDLKELEQFG